MKVYRIWNETKQCWYRSFSGRIIWTTKAGASLAKNYYLNTFQWSSPDTLIIKQFELTNEKEIN